MPQPLVTVVVWEGTRQQTHEAFSYCEALTLASRNQNAYPPTFYEKRTGKKLYDNGNGLCDEDHNYVC